jgi:hypothetical protein
MSRVEVIAVKASMIAIIQIADRIVRLCKFYIKAAQDMLSNLRVILFETLTLKTIFENLQFLMACSSKASATVRSLASQDGLIKGC